MCNNSSDRWARPAIIPEGADAAIGVGNSGKVGAPVSQRRDVRIGGVNGLAFNRPAIYGLVTVRHCHCVPVGFGRRHFRG